MQLFRKLADNFFFKIILAFVILTFVLFGVSGFLLGGNDNYVAKIGDKTIGYKDFIEASRNDANIIRSSTNSKEAAQYLESKSFKRDVLGRLISKKVSEILADEYGFIANQELILRKIVSDKEFQGDDGSFDANKFNNFLKNHSLNEQKYIDIITNEIITAGVIQSFTVVAPANKSAILELANLDKEKRQISVVEVKKNKIGRIARPKNADLENFYAENKENYRNKEIRNVEILSFSKKDLETNFLPSEDEIKAKYEENKSNFTSPEVRDFLHVVFDKEEDGQAFLSALEKKKGKKLTRNFTKLAKEKLNKNLDNIKLSNITKKGLLPSIADDVFALKSEELSKLLKSELGYHIFLTTKIIKETALSYDKARETIIANLTESKRKTIVEDKISQINDIILESNSLTKVVSDLKLKNEIITTSFDDEGNDQNGKKVKEIAKFNTLITNAFTLGKDKISKIYYTKDYQGFYIFKISDITESSYKEFSQVKGDVEKDFLEKNRNEKLVALAEKIAKEVKENPKKASIVARKNRATYRYKTFVKASDDNAIANNVFSMKLGESSQPILTKDGNYSIVILQEIIPAEASDKEFEEKKIELIRQLRKEILQKYDAAISEKYPVSINEKIFAN